MKRIKSLVFILTILFGPMCYAESWVDSWFDNAVYSSPSSFQDQQRGFYSGGSFSARNNIATDNPISFTAPRISAGCGGIDIFGGGLSFLSEKHLVKHFQNIMQAAPGVAFDMAMKTMCKECADTMKSLKAMEDGLNSMQINDCAMSKRMVATVSSGDPNILGAMWDEMTADSSLNGAVAANESYQDVQEDIRANHNKPIEDLKKRTDGCPAKFKNIFKNGSIVSHATDEVGLTAYSDIIRGYIGDVKIKAGDDDKIPTASAVAPCPQNDKSSLDDMLYGRTYTKNEAGTCVQDSSQGVIAMVHAKLVSIADKMKRASAPLSESGIRQDVLSEGDIDFISKTPNVPVYSILRKAIIKGNVDTEIDVMTDVVAISYTWYIFDDLYRQIDFMFNKVNAITKNPSATADEQSCDVTVYAQAIDQFKALHEELLRNKLAVASSYQKYINGYRIVLQFQQLHKDDEEKVIKRVTGQYGV